MHGKVDRDDYTVEKVYLESYPGFFVSGSLYRPKGKSKAANDDGKLPAVLSPHGHWPGGRFYDAGLAEVRRQIATGAEQFESGRFPLQARCVQLARMGCIVFEYDMVGYADSQQLAHRSGDRAAMDTPEHWGFFSPQAEARLQSIFGLQTYDSICALDFLCGLPDVDATRIGVTGSSGGGTQTFILGAIDSRPAANFPAVMVSTAMQGGCPCENASCLRVGTGNVELAGLFAPKPLGMTAADDWTKEIAVKGLPQLKQLYKLYGAGEHVMATPLLQFPHNYNYPSRAVMYAWFNKHLKLGITEPIVERDFQPLSGAEMSVWDSSHPRPRSGDDFERSLLERMTDDSRHQIEALVPKDERSLEEYRRVVGSAVEVMIGRGLPLHTSLKTSQGQFESRDSYCVRTFMLQFPEHGEEIPCVRLRPLTLAEGKTRGTVIWVDRLGKQGLFTPSGTPQPHVITLMQHGFTVLGADLFGQGEFTADGRPLSKGRLIAKYPERKESWGCYAGYTFGYNQSLFAQRVSDILSLIAYSKSETDGEHVEIVGLAGAGHWAAAACAIAGPAVDRAAIDTGGFRFAKLTSLDDPDFLPGGAKYGDLPGMIGLLQPRRLWLAGEDVPSSSVISKAFTAAGHTDHLIVWDNKQPEEETSAVVAWLLKDAP
jgi:dienelactone hydrolase